MKIQFKVLDKICRDELGLGPGPAMQLQNGVKKYIEAWNMFAVPGQRFNELNDREVNDYAERYLDQGWNRNETIEKGAEIRVAPGKHLFQPTTGSTRSTYKYTKDAKLICKGVEKLFQLLKTDIQGENASTSYPTPVSAQKRRGTNNADADSSSNSDSINDESLSIRKGQGQDRAVEKTKSTGNRNPQKPQVPDDDTSFRPTPFSSDTLEASTSIATMTDLYTLPLDDLPNPLLSTKSKSPRQQKTATRDAGMLSNQRTLKETGFITVDKPCANIPSNEMNDVQSKRNLEGAGNDLKASPTTPTVISDDESLPENPIEFFNKIKTPQSKESASTNKHAQKSLRDARDARKLNLETPTKRRKTAGRSIVRSSKPVKGRKARDRELPHRIINAVEAPEPAVSLDPAGPQLDGKASFVANSPGSLTPREVSRAASIDLGEPTSELPAQTEEARPGSVPENEEPVVTVPPPGVNRIGLGNESINQSLTHDFVNFWILTASEPRNKWTNWADATLERETIHSIFAALHRATGGLACTVIDVQLQNLEEEYTFQVHRNHSDRFEALKFFMLQIIARSHREKGPSTSMINIYLRPGSNLVGGT